MSTVVETTKGKVEGRIVDRQGVEGVHAFRGIPFARAPRFRPPEPAEGWTGVRDATAFGAIACQNPSPLEAILGSKEIVTGEECLSLNVWTPAPDGARRPVMVWIHGGAFVTGSGSTPWYDGASFARTTDAVVVSINYRLGAFGFLHLEDMFGEAFAGSGIAGILDQVAALEWVRDNIAAFGGDAGNVTIFGESAGGMSVGTLLGLPAAKGLFHRAIPQSGAGHNTLPRERAAAIATEMLTELGIGAVDGAAALERAPVEQVLAAQLKITTRHAQGALPFQPVVDGMLLPRRPVELVAEGSASGVDVLTGTTLEEMKLFTMMDRSLGGLDESGLLKLAASAFRGDADRAAAAVEVYRGNRPGASPLDVYVAMATDQVFRIPAIRLLEAQEGHGSTFAYLFTFASSAFGGALGSCHALEIPFVFNNLDAPGVAMLTGPADDPMRALAAFMHGAWGRFASGGDPGWDAYDTTRRATHVLDLDRRLVDDPAADERALWDGIL